MLFCEECGKLKHRRKVRGELRAFCPGCDDDPGGGRSSGRPKRRELSARERARARSPSSKLSRRKPGRSGRRHETPTEGPEALEVPDDADLFPFETVRPGQDELMADVRRTVQEGRHLVAYAPTGLGKTAAVLVPALEEALPEGRVFFLTSTQSQHKIATDTLKRIRDRTGLDLVVGDVIGKQSMCARDEAEGMHHRRFAEFCRREQANGTCTYWENDNRDAVESLKRDVVPVEEIVHECRTGFHVCPHQTALDVASQAHVVVCDYNYFFSDLSEPMAERLRVDLEDAVLVVDEAHNLPERVRDHLAVRLTPYLLDDAGEELNDLAAQAHPTTHLAKACAALREILEETAPEGDGDEVPVDGDAWAERVDATLAREVPTISGMDYDGLLDELETAAEDYRETFKEPSRALVMLREFLRNWRVDRDGLVRYARRDTAPTLVYQLLDPRILSRPVFGQVHASILMSGTLHPTRMYRDVLGLARSRTDLRSYDDPFPDDHRLVLVDDSVTTKYEARDDAMYDRIASRIAACAEATPGNVATFVPSYALLERIRERLAWELKGKELVVEERGQDKRAKQGLVDTLHGSEDSLLLGVLGGSLSEGIDYADNVLETVIVVGMPFARPTLEVQALIDHYKGIFGGRGYMYAYVHPAMNRVLQAVGRPIRSADDRAAVVLMDERFTWSRYRGCFPDDLAPRPVDDVARAVRSFWQRA